jgi:hypothetical protein
VGIKPMFGKAFAVRALRAIALSLALMLAPAAALAQEGKTESGAAAPSPPPAPAPSAPTPADPSYRPGFIDAFGRFIGDSAAKVGSQLKGANETLGNIGSQTSDAAKGAVGAAKNAVDKARDAAGTIISVPSIHMVSGHELCGTAANGAPDCRAAADSACRAKGFASGRSLDTQSTQMCPVRVLLSGRPPTDGDCPVETFVTRVVCQ